MNTAKPFNYSGKLAVLIAASRDPRLTRADVAVLSVIVDHASQQTGEAYPSVNRIVQEAGVPRTTVLRALQRIEAAGWVRAERRQRMRSTYWLTGITHGTRTGAISKRNWCHLRRGTGATDGTKLVPPTDPEQREERIEEEQREKNPPPLLLGFQEMKELWNLHALDHWLPWRGTSPKLEASIRSCAAEQPKAFTDCDGFVSLLEYVKQNDYFNGKRTKADGTVFDLAPWTLFTPHFFFQVVAGGYETAGTGGDDYDRLMRSAL